MRKIADRTWRRDLVARPLSLFDIVRGTKLRNQKLRDVGKVSSVAKYGDSFGRTVSRTENDRVWQLRGKMPSREERKGFEGRKFRRGYERWDP